MIYHVTYTNVCHPPSETISTSDKKAFRNKLNITRFPFEISRLAQDIAGGLLVTLPSIEDQQHAEIGAYVKKYFTGKKGVDADTRMRLLRLIENITLGTAAVGYLTESMHGAGSPQAQRIMILREGELDKKIKLAKALTGIPSKAKAA